MKKAPQFKRLVFGMSAHIPTKKERDDEAIEWLCQALDTGTPPGTGWPFIRESWSIILRRRINGKYPKGKSDRVVWTDRHFYLRMVIAPTETDEQKAKHVAAIWKEAGHDAITAISVKSSATRKAAKDEASAWLVAFEKPARDTAAFPCAPNIETMAVYQALESAMRKIAEELRHSKKSR